MGYYANLAREVMVIVTCLTAIVGIIYWVLRTKLKEDLMKDYCQKQDCDRKHNVLDEALINYRKDIAEELKEIKGMVAEIRKMVFDFISKK